MLLLTGPRTVSRPGQDRPDSAIAIKTINVSHRPPTSSLGLTKNKSDQKLPGLDAVLGLDTALVAAGAACVEIAGGVDAGTLAVLSFTAEPVFARRLRADARREVRLNSPLNPIDNCSVKFGCLAIAQYVLF